MKKLSLNYSPSKKEGIRTGIKFNEGINLGYPFIKEKSPEKILKCFAVLYTVYINDSLIDNPNYYFYTHHNNNEKGIISMIETKNLKKGQNTLKITKNELENDSIITNDFAYLPFWLE